MVKVGDIFKYYVSRSNFPALTYQQIQGYICSDLLYKCWIGTSGRRSSRWAFGQSTVNNGSGYYLDMIFFSFFSFFSCLFILSKPYLSLPWHSFAKQNEYWLQNNIIYYLSWNTNDFLGYWFELSKPHLNHNSTQPNITLSWVRQKRNVSNISAVTDTIQMKL